MGDLLDTSYHTRRRTRRMEDPEFREHYERARAEIEQTDAIIRFLEGLREAIGMSKAELARRVERNPSSIRRLLTADSAKPELPTIAAIAQVLGAEIKIVPRSAEAKRAIRKIKERETALV